MIKDEIFEKVKAIIQEILRIIGKYDLLDELTLETRLSEDLGFDSFDQMLLMDELKKEFNISELEFSAAECQTIGDICDFVAQTLE